MTCETIARLSQNDDLGRTDLELSRGGSHATVVLRLLSDDGRYWDIEVSIEELRHALCAVEDGDE